MENSENPNNETDAQCDEHGAAVEMVSLTK
jgi:hypothetical protein